MAAIEESTPRAKARATRAKPRHCGESPFARGLTNESCSIYYKRGKIPGCLLNKHDYSDSQLAALDTNALCHALASTNGGGGYYVPQAHGVAWDQFYGPTYSLMWRCVSCSSVRTESEQFHLSSVLNSKVIRLLSR